MFPSEQNKFALTELMSHKMTRKELERKLEQLGCLNRYSLDGSLCSDRRILYKNRYLWDYCKIGPDGKVIKWTKRYK